MSNDELLPCKDCGRKPYKTLSDNFYLRGTIVCRICRKLAINEEEWNDRNSQHNPFIKDEANE